METEDLLRRCRNEARMADALNHPNIITIYDAGEQAGVFYIAMEPGNVMLAAIGAVKVMDFGITKEGGLRRWLVTSDRQLLSVRAQIRAHVAGMPRLRRCRPGRGVLPPSGTGC